MLGILSSLVGLVGFAAIIMLIVKAFGKSVLWGVISIFTCGLGALVFALLNLSDAAVKKWLLIWCAAFAVNVVLIVMGGGLGLMKLLHHGG